MDNRNREEFEEMVRAIWPQIRGVAFLLGGDMYSYTDFTMNERWKIWQAATAQSQAELAKAQARIAELEKLVPIGREVLAFLYGIGELDSCVYGEKPLTERGNFWWRKYLPPLPPKGEANDN